MGDEQLMAIHRPIYVATENDNIRYGVFG